MLIIVVLVVLTLNALNVYLSALKLQSAAKDPSIAISKERRIVIPPVSLLVCAGEPGVSLRAASLMCTTIVYDPFGGVVNSSGPCEGALDAMVSIYSCVNVPVGGPNFHFVAGGDFYEITISGATTNCVADLTACFANSIYYRVTAGDESGRLDELARLPDVGEISGSQLRPYEYSTVSFDMSRTVRLSGASEFTFTPRLVNMRTVADQLRQPGARVNFMLQFNDLSFPTSNLVFREQLRYDYLDFITSVAAIASLTYSLFKLLFTSSPTVPMHWRFGRHSARRKLGDLLDARGVEAAELRDEETPPVVTDEETSGTAQSYSVISAS